MSSPLEKTVEAHLVKRCKALGFWTAKFTSPARAGVPDRIVAVPCEGKTAAVHFLELKREGGVPTKLQEFTHQQMREHGMSVHVLCGRAEVDAWLEQQMEERQ